MNEALNVLLQRRSCRSYRPDPIPGDILDQILEAGTFAATGMGRQSPIMIAVTDKAMRDRLSRMNAAVMGAENDPFYGAPVVIAVLADRRVPTYLYDGSLVMGNLMNAAHALGIGSCWIHRAKEEFESPEGKEILRSLGIGDGYEGIGHLALGYPAAPDKQRAVAGGPLPGGYKIMGRGQDAAGVCVLKGAKRLLISQQPDIADLARAGDERLIMELRQEIHHLLARAGLFPQIVFIRFAEALDKCRSQADLLKHLAGGRLRFRFAAFRVTLGKAVRSRHFLHDHIQRLPVPHCKYHRAAGFFPVHHVLLFLVNRELFEQQDKRGILANPSLDIPFYFFFPLLRASKPSTPKKPVMMATGILP